MNKDELQELAKQLYVAKTRIHACDCERYGSNVSEAPSLEGCYKELSNKIKDKKIVNSTDFSF